MSVIPDNSERQGFDPEREITYAFLSAGLMEDSYSLDRHQCLADLVFCAMKNP